MHLNSDNAKDARDQPPSITLDISEDADSLRLWWLWQDLTPAFRKRLVAIAETEFRKRLDFMAKQG